MSKVLDKAIEKIIIPGTEHAYELPESWVWTVLDGIGDINPRNKDLPDDITVSFVPMASVDDITGKYLGQEEKLWNDVKKGYTHMAENDVIFAKITPCMENGKSAVVRSLKNGFGAGSTEFHVFRPKGVTVPEYVHAFLRQKSFRKFARNHMTGSAGQKRVPTNWFKKIHFPLPPLAEQQRIVESLYASFEVISEISERLSRAKELLHLRHEALLVKAFRGELVPQYEQEEASRELLRNGCNEETGYDIPKGWVWSQLGNIAKVINGRAYKKEELLDIGPTPVLRVGNLFTSTSWYYSDLELQEDKYCNKGDLLYAWSASFGPRIWEGPRAIYHYHIWKIDIIDTLIEKKFLYYFLEWNTQEIKSKGHGTSMLHITKGGMEKTLIPIPPLEEQKRIVERLEQEFQKENETLNLIEKAEVLLENLRESLFNKAFRGELVEQRHEEGTGIELLKKIIDDRLIAKK